MGVDKICPSVDRVVCGCRDAEFALNQLFLMELNSYTTSSFIPECVLRQKYLENRLSMQAIASEFSCSKTHIRDQLLKYNIPLRKQGKHKSRWYAYGNRKICGKTIDHKGELRTITTIKQMYSEGISTAAIARLLDTMKIPTKQQGKGWHHHTITQILKRGGVHVEAHRHRAAKVSYHRARGITPA